MNDLEILLCGLVVGIAIVLTVAVWATRYEARHKPGDYDPHARPFADDEAHHDRA